MSPQYRKLVLKFKRNSSLNLENIFSTFTSNIQYIGLYEVKLYKKLYIQFKGDKRVVPNTLKKHFVSISLGAEIIGVPEPFTNTEGALISEIGEYLNRGRKLGSKVVNGSVVNNSNTVVVNSNTVDTPQNVMNMDRTSLAVLARAYRTHIFRKSEEQMIVDNETKFAPLYTGYGNNWCICGWVQTGVVGVRKKVKPREKDFLYESQNGKCVFCESVVPEDYSNSDVDHIIPLSLGGTCEMDNLQILCIRCHRKKTGLESRRIRKSTKEMVLHKSM